VLELAQGGQGSGKTMAIVQSAYKASKGHYDPLIRRKNPVPYSTHSNLSLSWIPSCSMRDGDLSPLELVDKVRKHEEYASFTTLVFTELHRWMESRLTAVLSRQSKAARLLLDYLIDESRKRHFNFLMDTQNRFKLENRIRDYATYTITCQNRAKDKEFDDPILEYLVVQDIESISPNGWRMRPGKAWWKFYGSLFDTWETPSRKTEIEVQMEEYERLEQDMKLLREHEKEAEEDVEEDDLSEKRIAKLKKAERRAVARHISIDRMISSRGQEI